MSNFADLILGADTRGLLKAEQSLRGVSDQGRATEASTTRSTRAMSAGFASLALAAGSVVSVSALLRGALASIGRIDGMDESAASIDGTVNALRALQLATGEAGINSGELMASLQAMNREIAKAQVEAGPARAALDQLGLSARQLSAMDADTRLAAMSDAMRNMNLSAGQATAVLQDLGVRSKAMSVAMLDGGDAIRSARQDIADLGLELDQNTINQVAAANDALGRMALAGEALGNALAITLAPALTALATGFVDALREGGALRIAIDATAASISAFTNNIDVLAISVGVLAVRSMIGFVASLGSVGFALAASLIATNALAFAMTALPLVGLVAGLTLAWRWYNSTDEATRAAAAATDLAAQANIRMDQTLQAVASGLATTSEALRSVSLTETMIASQAAAKVASEAFDQVSVGIYDVMRANIALNDSTIGVNTGFNNLVASVRNGSTTFAELRSKMDEVSAAAPELAPYVAELMKSITAAESSADSAERLSAMMRVLQGTATQADYALVGAGTSARALSSTLSGMQLGGSVTGQVQFLASQLGVALDVATALNQTLNDAAGIETGGPSGPGLSFGLSAPAINDVGNAVLGFGRTTNRARREIQDMTGGVNQLTTSLGGGGGGGGAAGAVDALSDSLAGATDELTPAQQAAKDYADTISGYFTDTIGNAVDWMVDGFKGGMKSLFQIFADGIKQMIAFAIKNKIMAYLGLGGSVAGGAAQAATGAAGGGVMSGIGSALSAMGGAFMSGLSSVWSGLMTSGLGGAFSAVGTAISGVTGSLTSLATAAGAIALPLLAVGAIFLAFKKKITVLDAGLLVTIKGLTLAAHEFERVKTTRLFGLISNTETNFSAAGAAVQNPLRDAYEDVRGNVTDMAAVLGIGASSFAGFSHSFQLSLKGLTQEQTQAAIAAEFQTISDKLARMALGMGTWRDLIEGVIKGTSVVFKEGETATQALARLSSSLVVVNSAFTTLGFDLLDVSIAGGAAASGIVDVLGGLEAFAQATEAYFQNFYTLAERTAVAQSQFNAALADVGVRSIPQTTEAFRRMVDQLIAVGRTADAAELIGLGPMFLALQQLKDEAAGTVGPIEDLGRSIADIMQERLGLEGRWLMLMGRTSELHRRELMTLDPSNRALRLRIWGLEREQAVHNESLGLQRTLLELNGRTAEIRRRELLALDPTNRAMQVLIWRLQDQATAADLAATAAQALADKQRSIADERLGLQKQLWELQGNTVALRNAELAALDPTNRALQRMIWGLEDAKAAMDDLDPAKFATLLDFTRAQIRARNPSGVLAIAAPAQMAARVDSNVVEMKTYRDDQKKIFDAIERSLAVSAAQQKRATDILSKFDVVGMPPVRA